MVTFNYIKLPLLIFGLIQFAKCEKAKVDLNLFLESEEPHLYNDKNENESFMGKHAPSNVDHVLTISISGEFKRKLVNPTSKDLARQRLTEFQNFVKELEKVSEGKLKVRTLVLTNFFNGKVHLIPEKLGEIIDKLWQKFKDQISFECVSTYGFQNFNVPVLCKRTGKPYRIYENPYLTYFFMNLSNEGITPLLPDMAKEYPVPLPKNVMQNSKQAPYQDKTVGELIALQNDLMESIKPKLPAFYIKYRMDQIRERRKKMQEKIIADDTQNSITFSIYNCQNAVETPKEIKIYRHAERPFEYVPDPRATTEYTYLDDASSTKLVLAIILDGGPTGNAGLNDDEWKYVYDFAKWLMEVSENLLVRIIVTKGLYPYQDAKGLVGDFLDEHGQRKDGKHPLDFVLTFGFNSGNKVHQNYLNRYFTVYENPYLRYIFAHMRGTNCLDPIRKMAEVYPVRSPAIVREDENGRLLQIKMQMDIEKVQNDVQIQLLEKLSQSTTNFDPKEMNELKKKISKNTKKGKLPEGVTEDQRSKIEAAKFEFIDVFGSGGGGPTLQLPSRKRRNSQDDAASSNKSMRTG